MFPCVHDRCASSRFPLNFHAYSRDSTYFTRDTIVSIKHNASTASHVTLWLNLLIDLITRFLVRFFDKTTRSVQSVRKVAAASSKDTFTDQVDERSSCCLLRLVFAENTSRSRCIWKNSSFWLFASPRVLNVFFILLSPSNCTFRIHLTLMCFSWRPGNHTAWPSSEMRHTLNRPRTLLEFISKTCLLKSTFSPLVNWGPWVRLTSSNFEEKDQWNRYAVHIGYYESIVVQSIMRLQVQGKVIRWSAELKENKVTWYIYLHAEPTQGAGCNVARMVQACRKTIKFKWVTSWVEVWRKVKS